jgi:hypothetical protein
LTAKWQDRPAPWAETEYLALDETMTRIELIDGRFHEGAWPTWEHQEISRQLREAIRSAAAETTLRVAGRDYRSVRLRLFRICGDRYELHGSAGDGETLVADGPFHIEIRTADLRLG